ncbi:MAG: ACP S-malonyltransferase [Candidatus Pelethousia sp.]|nr:ACP S-malonyltransferase [Candidatus Pelethousia sp.]
MKLALLFAGQGAQHVGMGKDLYEAYPAFRAVLDKAEQAVDFDLKALCFEGPEEILLQTQYTQPCMVAFAAGVAAVLKEARIEPAAAAGLSLGEYSALCAAGVFDAETVIALAAFRGKAMARAVLGRACSMAAVLGLGREALQQACVAAQNEGVAEIANYNCPGQMVLGGDAAAVERACRLAKEAGAKRCMPLNVSGPFHTSLMAPAGDALRERFREIQFSPMRFPVYFNCLGGPMGGEDTVPDLLEKQVQSAVYFEDILLRMERDGVDAILEIGPGKVLSGFVKKTAPRLAENMRSAETAQALSDALAWLKEGQGC